MQRAAQAGDALRVERVDESAELSASFTHAPAETRRPASSLQLPTQSAGLPRRKVAPGNSSDLVTNYSSSFTSFVVVVAVVVIA